MSDIDMMPDLLENFALEWEADIRFNKMSDGSEPGPYVKIRPREQGDRVTVERRIAFMRKVAAEILSLRQQLAEARERETLHRADATCAWKEAEALRYERDEARDKALEEAVEALEAYAQRLVPDPANDRARYHLRYGAGEVRAMLSKALEEMEQTDGL